MLSLDDGIFFEDCNILVPWGMSLRDIAKLLKIPGPKKNDFKLNIGSRILFSGLHLSDVDLMDQDFDRNVFSRLEAYVKPEALDHLEGVVGIQLQPSAPVSTFPDFGYTQKAKVQWRNGSITLSYGTGDYRGEGDVYHYLSVENEDF